MRVTGAATLSAPAGTVQTALRNPDLLARAIPGCERLDVTGAGRCQLTVTTAIAAVSGRYAGEAVLVERRDAAGLVVATVAAAGNRGSATCGITLRLEPAGEGATQVSYDLDATVTGPVAGIGQRMLASIASRLAAEFFAALGGLLAEQPATESTEVPAAEAQGAEAQGAKVPAAEAPVGAPILVESMVVGPTVVRRPDEAAARLDQPRATGRPAVRAGVLAGGAVGLAGIVIGAVLGRRNRGSAGGSR
jgi:carbon monoxide dehydrogenase subunit G